jgi:hypothetical protein
VRALFAAFAIDALAFFTVSSRFALRLVRSLALVDAPVFVTLALDGPDEASAIVGAPGSPPVASAI